MKQATSFCSDSKRCPNYVTREIASDGFSIIELVTTLALISIVAAIATTSLQSFDNHLANSSDRLAMTIRLARTKAIATTKFYIIKPTSSQIVDVFEATSCDDLAPNLVQSLSLILAKSVTLEDSAWQICFSPLGVADNSPTFRLRSDSQKTKTLTVFTGGAIKVE